MVSKSLSDALTHEMDKTGFNEGYRKQGCPAWMSTALKILCSKSTHGLPRCSTDILFRFMLLDFNTVQSAIMTGSRISENDLETFLATFREALPQTTSFGLVDCMKLVLRTYAVGTEDCYDFHLRAALSATRLSPSLLGAFIDVLYILFAKEASRDRHYWAASNGRALEALNAILWASWSGGISDPQLKQLFKIILTRISSRRHVVSALMVQSKDLIFFASEPVAQALQEMDCLSASQFLQDLIAASNTLDRESHAESNSLRRHARSSLVKLCLFAMTMTCTRLLSAEHLGVWQALFTSLAVSLRSGRITPNFTWLDEEGVDFATSCLELLGRVGSVPCFLPVEATEYVDAMADIRHPAPALAMTLDDLVGDDLVDALANVCGATDAHLYRRVQQLRQSEGAEHEGPLMLTSDTAVTSSESLETTFGR